MLIFVWRQVGAMCFSVRWLRLTHFLFLEKRGYEMKKGMRKPSLKKSFKAVIIYLANICPVYYITFFGILQQKNKAKPKLSFYSFYKPNNLPI